MIIYGIGRFHLRYEPVATTLLKPRPWMGAHWLGASLDDCRGERMIIESPRMVSYAAAAICCGVLMLQQFKNEWTHRYAFAYIHFETARCDYTSKISVPVCVCLKCFVYVNATHRIYEMFHVQHVETRLYGSVAAKCSLFKLL